MPTPRGAWRKPWCKAPAPRSAACGALWRGGAAALAGRGAAAGVGLPAAPAPYVEKVARHAYLVTDADVAALRDGGYSGGAVFEITLSAALWGGRARLAGGVAAPGEDRWGGGRD